MTSPGGVGRRRGRGEVGGIEEGAGRRAMSLGRGSGEGEEGGREDERERGRRSGKGKAGARGGNSFLPCPSRSQSPSTSLPLPLTPPLPLPVLAPQLTQHKLIVLLCQLAQAQQLLQQQVNLQAERGSQHRELVLVTTCKQERRECKESVCQTAEKEGERYVLSKG